MTLAITSTQMMHDFVDKFGPNPAGQLHQIEDKDV